MGRVIRTACYIVGIIIIMFGLALINEYYAEITTVVTVPHLTTYPYVGSVLIIIGAIIIYLAYRTREKARISLS